MFYIKMWLSIVFSFFLLTLGNQNTKSESEDLLEMPIEESFDKLLNITIQEFTSCEQFLNNTVFDPMRVVDIDWKIFYFWNIDPGRTYHIKFHLPTPVLVKRFSVEMDEELEPPVDWTKAELWLETGIDVSGLLIKTNVSGLYRMVSSFAFEQKTHPEMLFALKIVEPGYLGIMNCKYRMCHAMAPVDMFPGPDEVEQAAKKIGFHGQFGTSYLVNTNPSLPKETFHEVDDDDDDLEMELERDVDRLELF